MKSEEFKRIYHESRSGANHFVRHWAARKFQYSDGVEACAATGLGWFLDICATELPQLIPYGDMGIVFIRAEDGMADLSMELQDDVPPVWQRKDIHTDCPDGTWMFYIVNEGERFAMILPEEN